MKRVRGEQWSQPPAVVVLPMPEAAPTGIGVVRGLGQAGVPVIVVGEGKRSLSLRSRFVSATWKAPAPATDGEGFLQALLALAEELPARTPLFLTTDAQVQLAHAARAELEAAYAYPFLDDAAFELCTDKAQTAALSDRTDVPAPITIHVYDGDSRRQALETATFPAVVKPTRWAKALAHQLVSHERLRSAWGTKAIRATHHGQLEMALSVAAAECVPVVVQEEIPGASSCIFVTASYSDEAGRPLAMFTGRKTRQLPSDLGTGTMLESATIEELSEHTRRLLQAARICGQADTEYKLDPRDGLYKLMEINPRPATWNGLCAASGVNCHYAAYLHLLGQPVPQLAQVDGVRWIDGWPDLKYFLKYRKGDHTGQPLSLASYLSSLRGRRTWAYWDAEDPLPGLVRAGQIARRQFAKLGRSSSRQVASDPAEAAMPAETTE